jgi:organic radical activating enzyme
MSECLLFKNGVHIDTNGLWNVCCVPPGLEGRPQFNTYKEYKQFAEPKYEQSKTEWIPGCSTCKYSEDTKNNSTRLKSNDELKHTDPSNKSIKWAIMNTGKICNLACRMCGPGCSTKWFSHIKNHTNYLYRENELESYEPGVRNIAVRNVYSQETMDQIYEHVLTPELIYVSFGGGEPTQNYRTEEIIQYCIEKGYARNMKMHVITNGTRPFKDSWKDALDEFKYIHIDVSMDGTHDNYNYIRHGANFDEVMENILDIKDQIIKKGRNLKESLSIAYCLQALNAHKFSYDKDYYESKGIWFNYVVIHDPDHATLASIPTELMEKYKLKDLYPQMYQENMLQKLAGSQRWMDQMFNDTLGDFEKQCPDLFKYSNVKDIYYRGPQ